MFAEGNANTRLQETTSLTLEHDAGNRRDEVLQRLRLADAPREDLFDDITRLAAEAIGAPFALITIIDERRQFFVSSHGLPPDLREGPIDTSLCRWPIESAAPVAIFNVRTNPLSAPTRAWQWGCQSYLAVPVFSGDVVIATLCVADRQVREWTRRDLAMLESLARLLARELDNRVLQRLAEEKEQQLRASEARFRQVFDNAAVALLKTDWSAVLARFAELRAAGTVDLEAHLAERPGLLDELLALIEAVAVNPETLRLFGAKDQEELIRWQAEGCFGEGAREANRQALLAAWRGESGLQSECHLQTLKGTPIDVVFSIRFLGRNGKRALTSIMDISKVKRAQARLRTGYETTRRMIEGSPFGTFVVDPDLRILVASEGTREMFRMIDPLLGTDCETALKAAWSEPFASEMLAQLRHTRNTGETYRACSRIARRADNGETQSFDWQLERIGMPDGREGVICRFYDLSERHRQEQQIRTLMQEVNHRSKNILALVQAVAMQTAARSPEEFLPRFIERIRALAAAQDLLVNGAWRSVDLRALIESQLAHFQDALDTRQIVLSGPDFAVSAAAAQSLGMAFHELATNAGKYGALSRPQGRVAISWRLDAGDVDLQWRETGGPAIPAPVHRGFGTVVTKDLLRSSLDGHVEIAFAPTGLIWRARCPQERLREKDQPGSPWQDQSAIPAPDADKGPRRILLVEDEALVAMDLAESLRDAGFTVLGPASTQLQAHALLDREDCDLAVLDVNLGGGESSASLAARLAEKQVPCLFLTGYAPDQLASPFRDGEVIAKPVIAAQLIERVTRLLNRPAS